MPKLFEDQNESDGSDGEEQLDMKVNEDYAKKYEKWRAGEELQKC